MSIGKKPGMYIETETVRCDLCEGNNCHNLYTMPDVRYRKYDQEFTVVECNNCGHRYLNPRPRHDELNKCYPAQYYEKREVANEIQRQRYLRQSGYFDSIKPGAFLDIGCARGAFCQVMLEKGWVTHGTDFVVHPQNVLPEKMHFKAGFLNEIRYPDDYFDAISAWGVFEHLLSPKIYFKEVKRILKENGHFVMMVPNGKSLWSRYAFQEDIPRHLHFFTKKTLKQYADLVRLKILDADYTNSIYSKPATGRELFRINLLRVAGVPWQEIYNREMSISKKLLSRFGRILDMLLIHKSWEEAFNLTGMMVITFGK